MNEDELFTDAESLRAKVVELQELQAKYESMVEAFDGLIYICSSDYRVEFMNRRFIARTGRNAVGEDCYKALHELESVCPWCVNERVFQGETVRWEVLSPKDQHWYYVVDTPIPHPDGSVSKMAMIQDVTERKQEENVRLARLRLMEFADTHTLEELLQATLDEAEALTGSLIGFYHLVDSDQRTLWLQSWSTRTLREMCTAEGEGLHYDVNEAGVWVDCVHERKPVIHNDYSALPHRRGMPIGHAKVTRELVVPVFRSDRIVAILGVGNKPVNYVQTDVEIVSLLADLAWDIAERKLADENLRRSEAKFLDLYENAPCAYLSVGTDAIIRLCNRRAGEFLGYSREELIGKPVLELYADQPEGKEKAEHIFKGFLAGEPIADEELQMQKADGSPLWISLTVNGVRDSDGHLVESRSMVLDISDRKRAEEAQRRLTRELRAISNCNQTLLRAVDEQTLVDDICRIICDEAGYRLAWVGYAENDDAKTIRPVAWAGFDSGYVADAKLSWADDTERGRGPAGTVIRSGEMVCVQDFATEPQMAPWRESALQRGYRSVLGLPLKDESAKVFGVLLIYHSESNAITPTEIQLMEELAGDLAFGIVTLRTRSERKRAEEDLRKMNERFSLATRAARLGVWDWDIQKNELVWDDGMYALYGIKREDLAGAYEAWLKGVHPDDRARSDEISKLAQRGEREYDTEFRVVWPDGSIHYLKAYGQIVRDTGGRPLRMTGINYDVTEPKRAEERLRLLSFAMNHVNEAVFLTDENARFRFVNEQSCRTLGYTREELLAMGVSDIDPDLPTDPWLRHWNDLKAQGSLVFETRHKTRDGRIFPVEINANYFEYGGHGYNLALARDITERKQAERERLGNLRFFESMDRVSRAIQGTNKLEQMMSDVLDAVFSIFDCDRSWLFYPCDPDAPSFRVPMEVTKPEYPGARMLNMDLPLPPDMAQNLLEALESAGPVAYTAGTEKPVNTVSADQFGVKSMMMVALYPKVGKPWAFGLHQCSYARVWTSDEKRLFQEIGRRLADGLSALLAYRNLRDNVGKLEEAQRIGRIGYWDRDIVGNQVTLADETCRIFGISAQESVLNLEQWHERWVTLVHPEDRQRVNQAYVEALASGPRYNVEYRIVRPDGEVRYVHSEANVTRDNSGHAIRILGMMQDVTEQKRGEEAVSRANKDWEQTFDAIPDMVMVLDSRHRILRANKAMCALLGLSEQELKGRFCFELVHDENEPPAFCPHSVVLKDGKEHSAEVYEPNLGRSLDVRVSPLSDETGTVIGSVHVIRDVTDQKNLQKQLLQAQKMESIGTLAGGIAHDFNNLLQIVVGYSDMLLFKKKPSDPECEGLHAIRQAARDGSELTKRILAFSRKLEPDSRPINLNNEINRIQKMLKRTVPRMIRIELRLAEDLMTVNADPSQMEQILLNLAVNAQHAMPDGGILNIETANVTLDKDYSRTHLDVHPGNYVLLTVSDTGHGIDKEAMEHIFEPFYTTKEPGVGTGLGLAMVFGIVKSHKGHISCRSAPGTGTTFKIYLPAIVQEIEQDVSRSRQMPAFGTETILLVDDDNRIRNVAQEMIEMGGYKVIAASSGEEALETYAARRDEVSLVVLDLIMPGIGGKKCLEELLRIDPDLRVLFASGYSSNGLTVGKTGTGARGFVRKPYDAKDILTAIRRVLDKGYL